MPNIGEIQTRVYKYPTHNTNIKLIWSACKNCGRERYVRFVKGKPEHQYCKRCASQMNSNSLGDTGCPTLDAMGVNSGYSGVTNFTRRIGEVDWVVVNACLNCALPTCLLG